MMTLGIIFLFYVRKNYLFSIISSSKARQNCCKTEKFEELIKVYMVETCRADVQPQVNEQDMNMI